MKEESKHAERMSKIMLYTQIGWTASKRASKEAKVKEITIELSNSLENELREMDGKRERDRIWNGVFRVLPIKCRCWKRRTTIFTSNFTIAPTFHEKECYGLLSGQTYFWMAKLHTIFLLFWFFSIASIASRVSFSFILLSTCRFFKHNFTISILFLVAWQLFGQMHLFAFYPYTIHTIKHPFEGLFFFLHLKSEQGCERASAKKRERNEL